MSSFTLSKRELCNVFMEHGKHVSSAQRYIKENFTLSEANFTCVISKIQKYLLPEFKVRWNRADRKKELFLKNNEQWLDGPFSVQIDNTDEPSTSSGSKRGRPCKSYELSSDRSQKRKATKLFRDSGLDHIHHSYIQGLKSLGEKEEASIVQLVRSASPESKANMHQLLLQRNTSISPYSKHEALSIFIDLDMTKAQFQYLRKCLEEKNCQLFPPYNRISQAKQECYPIESAIEITNISAKVKLQALLDHTVSRIFKIDSVDATDTMQLVLYSKWGCDGSSGQSEYKQILSEESEVILDAHVFVASIVPIKLVDQVSDAVIWQNPTPSSVRYCRPIFIELHKETPEKTRAVVHEIESQIINLISSLVEKQSYCISIKHKLFLTMIDGKISQVLTDTSSSAVCIVCGAKPSEMNDLERVKGRPENEDAFKFGLSTLHSWIRFMELVLHISYNLSFKKWSARNENKEEKARKKSYVQRRFREEMGLIIDQPRQNSGTSNDGNTARRFFGNEACTADITGVNEALIKRFHVILQTMSSGIKINVQKFGEYALQTAVLYVNNYNWYYMPSSVHKVLIHGENIIRYNAVLPLGQLSEDAQESRNKDYKRFRLHHARKCSRYATNEDVFHTLLYTSDPFITSLRRPSQKSFNDLDEEAVELLE